MKLQIFSVRDQASESFGTPFFSPTDAAAVRNLVTAALDKDSMIAKSPSDYSLWNVGEWDDVNARILPKEAVCVCNAASLLSLMKERMAFNGS